MSKNNYIKNISIRVTKNISKPVDLYFILCNILIITIHLTIIAINCNCSADTSFFNIGNFSITTFSLSGILSQVQVLANVYLCTYYGKKGYLLGLTYNSIYLACNITHVLMSGNTYPLLGSLISFGCIIVITVIYFFGKRLENVGKDLRNLAYTDSLTRLPNRFMFNEALAEYIKNNVPQQGHLIIVFIDLDNFKKINDNLGHFKGDLLLQLVAERLKGILHKEDFFARLSGDEFALLISRNLSKEELIQYLNHLQSFINQDYNLSPTIVSITASFGIALYPEHSTDPDELLMFADTAMYHVKDRGRNSIAFFEYGMKNTINRHFEIEKRLPTAWENGEMFLVYQPQFNATGNYLRGAEALLRWSNEELGFISPDEFIPIAEQSKLILPLGEWILKTACLWYIKNAHRLEKAFILSVNVSAVQLLDPAFVKRVEKVLTETGMSPQNLELELTESQYVTCLDHVINTLNALKDLGISIALDDFGTGYSTFSYIKNLPFDCIKIDRSFINEIHNADEAPIIKGILSLIHNVKMVAIAEGVETPVQQQYLIHEGCNVIQGYLLSQPLKEEAFFENEHVKKALSNYPLTANNPTCI